MKPKSYLSRHIFILIISIFIWYIFLPGGLVNLIPIIFICLSNWIKNWINSIHKNMDILNPLLIPFIFTESPQTINNTLVITTLINIIGLVVSFIMSTKTGLITLIATIVTYFIYLAYWGFMQATYISDLNKYIDSKYDL